MPDEVQAPKEITVIQGNHQGGTTNRELADTIIIKIKPNDTSDVTKYTFSSSGNEAVGFLGLFLTEVVNGELYIKTVWRTGNQSTKQDIKFYLLSGCSNPFNTTDCKRLDSVQLSATILKPWTSVHTTGGKLEDIYFTSDNEALAVGSYSSTGILRTSDGGKTWTRSPAFRDDLYQLRFLNSTTGLVTVTNNYAYFTYDGGKTFAFESWTPPTVGHLSSYDLYMVSRNVIYSVGNLATIMKTTDGGRSWQKYGGFTFINGFRAITCLDENTCYACGDVAKVVKTTNGGQSWQEQPVLLNNHLNVIHFLDKDFGFAAGQLGALIRTTNGGSNWNPVKTGLKFSIISIRFFDRQHGVIVSTAGEIAQTTDGGQTWNRVSVDNNGVFELKKAFIKDSKTVFAIQGSSIYKYDL